MGAVRVAVNEGDWVTLGVMECLLGVCVHVSVGDVVWVAEAEVDGLVEFVGEDVSELVGDTVVDGLLVFVGDALHVRVREVVGDRRLCETVSSMV